MPRLLAPLPSRSRRRRLLAILSNTFSASTAPPHRAPPPPPPPPLPQLSPLLPLPEASHASVSAAAADIAVSFRNWFLVPRASEPASALDAI